ncbi:MAG TPA: lipid-binding SYLF domain-containing protein [Terriglobales bacterium]|nr:lipid-binding SYLF domain-containing protein [Terriglobales bacterium]
MKLLSKLTAIGVMLGAMSVGMYAKDSEEKTSEEVKRINSAANVLDEIMGAPDKGIPQEVFEKAKCVAVVPSMIKGGFIVGARYGKGVATCRTSAGWSAPAPITIAGGSWGLQFGGEAVDLVMLVMNDKGMEHLLSSKFKLGAEGSVAAGPVGRQTEANTDWKMRAEVLSYSRARGIFAGLELNGAVVKQDDDDTRHLYGKEVPFKDILTGRVPPPEGTQKFVSTVSKYSAEARTERGAVEVPKH